MQAFWLQVPNQAFNMQHAFVNEIDEAKWFSTIWLSFFSIFKNVCEWWV